jgi:hypothetical protein
MTIFDWKTPAQAKIYTDAADRKRMAGEALGLLATDRTGNEDCRTEVSSGVAPK